MYDALTATLSVRGILPRLNTRTIINLGSMELDVEAVFQADLSKLILQYIYQLIDNFSKMVIGRIDAALKVGS